MRVFEWLRQRRDEQDRRVLAAVASGERYGVEIAKVAECRYGSLYPSLSRLEAQGHVTSDWNLNTSPPRRAYYVTEAGMRRLGET